MYQIISKDFDIYFFHPRLNSINNLFCDIIWSSISILVTFFTGFYSKIVLIISKLGTCFRNIQIPTIQKIAFER